MPEDFVNPFSKPEEEKPKEDQDQSYDLGIKDPLETLKTLTFDNPDPVPVAPEETPIQQQPEVDEHGLTVQEQRYIQTTLLNHGNQESNIPISDKYWQLKRQ